MEQFEKITIENISLVKERLQQLKANTMEDIVSLDLSSTHQIDLGGLQLLVSFNQSLEKNNSTLQLTNVSEHIELVLQTTGLDTYFTKG